MTAKAEYIPNGYVCNKCGSRMDAIITPPLSTLGKIKLVCNNCNKHMTKNWQDEFDKQNFTDAWAEDESNRIKQFISDIIDQTREETIREVEKMIKKEFTHQKLYCEAQDLRMEMLKELNKLKK
jgi:hypothetical protein